MNNNNEAPSFRNNPFTGSGTSSSSLSTFRKGLNSHNVFNFPSLGRKRSFPFSSDTHLTKDIGMNGPMSIDRKELLRRKNNRGLESRNPTRNVKKSNVSEMLTMYNPPFYHPSIISQDPLIRQANIEKGEPMFLLTSNIEDNCKKHNNEYQIYSATMLNYTLRKAFEHKVRMMEQKLTLVKRVNYFNNIDEQETKLENTKTNRIDYATTIEEFLEKVIFIGYYVSYDTPSQNPDTDAYSDRYQQYAVSATCMEGPYHGLPNIWGRNKDGCYFIGLIVKKRNILDFDMDITIQLDNPLQIYTWSSLKVRHPFIEDSQWKYNNALGIIQETLIEEYHKTRKMKYRTKDVKSISEFINKKHKYTLHQMMFLYNKEGGLIDFVRDDNDEDEMEYKNSRYTSLGFHDIDIYRDEKGRVIMEPVVEVGVFYKSGFVTFNEEGKPLDYSKCDEALTDITGRAFRNAMNNKIAATILM